MTDDDLKNTLISACDELALRGISALGIVMKHVNSKRERDPKTGRMKPTLGVKNAAPLGFFTGAPVAQNGCATGHPKPQVKPTGAKRATASLPAAQTQQSGLNRVIGSGAARASFLVIQIDMAKHPRSTASDNHTGDGVLFPVSCDGCYGSEDAARGVAEYLSEKHPHLKTYVVKIVGEVTP